jgi:hypothetical protein
VLIFIDISAGRGSFLSFVFAADETVHNVYQIIPS